MEEFFSLLSSIVKDGIDRVLTAWKHDAHIRNRSVKVVDGEREIFGTAIGIDSKTVDLKLKVGNEQVDIYEGTLFYV